MNISLNAEQQVAVDAGRGAHQIQAGAGSGKTRVLVERYGRLVKAGVLPEDILCLTFTRSAAQEMAERAGVGKLWRGGFMTFHSFAFKLIVKNPRLLPFVLDRKVVASGSKISSILKEVVRGLRVEDKTLKQVISAYKRAGMFPHDALRTAENSDQTLLAELYRAYEDRMQAEGFLDFEGLQLWTVHILTENANVRMKNQFDWLMVDEAQDCEPLQWEMMRLLSRERRNVFVVGDVNQAMYGFRGAAPDNLLRFPELFPGAKTLTLSVNYRSTESIVEYCKEIAPVKTELVERLRAASGERGERVELLMNGDEDDEAQSVLDRVAEPTKTAVLARTNRQLRAFEDVCVQRGVQYRLLGRSGFWQRREIQQVLAFARAAVNLADDSAIEEIILSPFPCTKYLGKKFVEKLRSAGCSLIAALFRPPNGLKNHESSKAENLAMMLRTIQHQCQGMAAGPAMRFIASTAGIIEHLRGHGAEDSDEPTPDNYALDNVEELIDAAGRFDSLQALVTHADKAVREGKEGKGLTLSTVHQAKGREWETVFVAGVTPDLLPHKRGDMAEEQRIYYVACSRAARKLYVSYFGAPSCFVTMSSLNEQVRLAADEPVPAGALEPLPDSREWEPESPLFAGAQP